MRYLLHKSQKSELEGRQKYLYDLFKMYFVQTTAEEDDGEFIQLAPVGDKGDDVLFIIGHMNVVHKYLSTHISQIEEQTIVVTSCLGRVFREFATQKKIYVPAKNQLVCFVRNGEPYGFEFDISDAELDFYNTKGSLKNRLKASYQRLH